MLFLGVSLISMILVGVFFHIYYSHTVKQDFHKVTDEATKRLNDHIEFYLEQVSRSTRTLADSDLIQAWMDKSRELNLFEVDEIETQLRRSVAFQYSEVVGIFLKSADNRVIAAPSFNFKEPDYMAEPWYHLPVPEKRVLLPTYRINYPQSQGMSVISIMMPVYSRSDLTLIGCVVIDLSLSEIETTLERSKIGKSGHFMMLSDDDTIVYHSNSEWRGTSLTRTPLSVIHIPQEGSVGTEFFEGKQILVSAHSSKATGWRVVAIVPFEEMAGGLNTAKSSAISAFVLIAVMVILIVPVLSNLFVEPILRLESSMNKVAAGDYDTRADFQQGSNEFQKLNNSFNKMVRQLEGQLHTIADLKLQELHARLRQKEAYIQALQNQINPHLLYNSLDVIKSIGYLHNNELVVSMAGNLAEVYRYTAKISDYEVTLREELTILEKYLEMARIRFPKKFRSDITVDPKYYSCLVIKLTLQPIVENAVKYAVHSGDGDTVISIRVYDEVNDLVIEIADNGDGIPENTKSELVSDLRAITMNGHSPEIARRNSLGISNVHSRIFLKYGEPYGINLSSCHGRGTLVSIRHPLQFAG